MDIIDEPANGRPGKPDRCPDKLYSLLFEHCWDPKPKDRSRFSTIQAKLQEVIIITFVTLLRMMSSFAFCLSFMLLGTNNYFVVLQETPQDVTLFFDLEKDSNPDNLVAKSGDLITVITWKSRLGTEFAKGQNKRTADVGYFPVSQGKFHNTPFTKQLQQLNHIVLILFQSLGRI